MNFPVSQTACSHGGGSSGGGCHGAVATRPATHGHAPSASHRRVALIGSGIDRNSVPAATHVLDYRDVERRGVPDLLWSLNQEIGGVDPRFGVGQSLPADSLLSRLSSLASAAQAAGPRGLCQRHALQPVLRRYGGLDPEQRHGPPGRRRVRSGVRPERPGRLDQRPDERTASPGKAASSACLADRSGKGRASSNGAIKASRCPATWPARCCTRTAGATWSRRTCRSGCRS
jgi:hypothetical protein